MRYNFHSNKVEDCKLAIAINIVNGKYPIGEKIPHKKEIADEYEVSRPTFNQICRELSDLNVIKEVEESYGRFYVPKDTRAILYVMNELTERLKKTSKLLEVIGFGAREARNQLFLKQIVNTLPLKLEEMENDGRILIHGEDEKNKVETIADKLNVFDESVNVANPDMQDIVDILQDML